MPRYDTEEAAAEALLPVLQSVFAERDWTPQLAKLMATEFQELDVNGESMPYGAIGYLAPKFSWIIRNDDRNVNDAFWKGATAAVAGCVAQFNAASTAIVGAIGAMYSLVRAVRRKGQFRMVEDSGCLEFVDPRSHGENDPKVLGAAEKPE